MRDIPIRGYTPFPQIGKPAPLARMKKVRRAAAWMKRGTVTVTNTIVVKATAPPKQRDAFEDLTDICYRLGQFSAAHGLPRHQKFDFTVEMPTGEAGRHLERCLIASPSLRWVERDTYMALRAGTLMIAGVRVSWPVQHRFRDGR